MGDIQGMINPGAKFPSICEPLTRQVVNFQNTMMEMPSTDIHTAKARNFWRLQIWTGPKSSNTNYTRSQDGATPCRLGPLGSTAPQPSPRPVSLSWGGSSSPACLCILALPSSNSFLIPSHLSPFQTMKALFLLVKDFQNPWSSIHYSGIQAIKQELPSSIFPG